MDHWWWRLLSRYSEHMRGAARKHLCKKVADFYAATSWSEDGWQGTRRRQSQDSREDLSITSLASCMSSDQRAGKSPSSLELEVATSIFVLSWGRGVVIELKFSDKLEHIERDASNALKQIVDQNYQNQEGLLNIRNLQEYGIASYHLASFIRGRYLELDT